MSVRSARVLLPRWIPHPSPGQRWYHWTPAVQTAVLRQGGLAEARQLNTSYSLTPPEWKPFLVLQTGAEGTRIQRTSLFVKPVSGLASVFYENRLVSC